MHGFAVKVGQQVKQRGELIGYVKYRAVHRAPFCITRFSSTTGMSTRCIIFFNDLNPAEYEKIVELASIENQSLGM